MTQLTKPTDPSWIAHAGTPNELWWDGSAWVKAPVTPVNLDDITADYVAIRNARAAAKAAFDRQDAVFEATLAKMRGIILEQMNAIGGTSIRTEHGTVYRSLKIKPSAADWTTIYDWVKENPERFELLEKRLKPTFVSQYMEEHEGETPPGVNVHREYEVSVRKN